MELLTAQDRVQRDTEQRLTFTQRLKERRAQKQKLNGLPEEERRAAIAKLQEKRQLERKALQEQWKLRRTKAKERRLRRQKQREANQERKNEVSISCAKSLKRCPNSILTFQSARRATQKRAQNSNAKQGGGKRFRGKNRKRVLENLPLLYSIFCHWLYHIGTLLLCHKPSHISRTKRLQPLLKRTSQTLTRMKTRTLSRSRKVA